MNNTETVPVPTPDKTENAGYKCEPFKYYSEKKLLAYGEACARAALASQASKGVVQEVVAALSNLLGAAGPEKRKIAADAARKALADYRAAPSTAQPAQVNDGLDPDLSIDAVFPDIARKPAQAQPVASLPQCQCFTEQQEQYCIHHRECQGKAVAYSTAAEAQPVAGAFPPNCEYGYQCATGGCCKDCPYAIQPTADAAPVEAKPVAEIERSLAQSDADMCGVGFLVDGLRVAPEWVTVIRAAQPSPAQGDALSQQVADDHVLTREELRAYRKRVLDEGISIGRAAGIEEAKRAAASVGRPVGASDGDTYVPGTSADAVRAIEALAAKPVEGV